MLYKIYHPFLLLSIIHCLIISNIDCSAQNSNYFLLPVSLITFSNDTIHTRIQFGNEFNLQYTLTSTDTSGNPLTIFTPREVKKYFYVVNKDTTWFISHQSPIGQIEVFMKLLYRSKIDLYQLIVPDKKKGPANYKVEYFLWKNGWELPAITFDNQEESLLAHFSDCFQLQFKIKSHEYGISQLKKIITEYENCELSSEYDFTGE